MNHIYKLVWSLVHQCWTPAAEFSCRKKNKKTKNSICFTILVFLIFLTSTDILKISKLKAQTISYNATAGGVVSPVPTTSPWNAAGPVNIGSNQAPVATVLTIDGGYAKAEWVRAGYYLNNPNTPDELIVKNGGYFDTFALSIGQSGVGKVTIESGSKLTTVNAVYLINAPGGYNGGSYGSAAISGSNASLLITGADSSISTTDNIWLGWGIGGRSEVKIENGGALYVRSIGMRDNSSFSIDGSGSKVVASSTLYLRVANRNPSNFSITNGGSLQTNSAQIGESTDNTPGATTLTVDGANSKWISNSILIGYSQNTDNTVTISNGGYVQAGNVAMGNTATGTNRLLINTGGTLATSQIKKINSSNSTSNIAINGGILRATSNQSDFISGFNSIEMGALGLTFNTDIFNVALNSIINNGNSAGTSTGSFTKEGSGTLTLSAVNLYSGGTKINSGLLIPTNNAALGTGAVTTGGVSSSAKLQINSDIKLPNTIVVQGQGLLYGSGEVGATTVNDGGYIQAGLISDEVGVLTINGNLVLNSGSTFHAQLATNGSYDSDLLSVNGNATLNNGRLIYTDVGDTYEYGNYYTVISTSGAVNGSLNVTGESPFLEFRGRVASNNGGTNNIYEIGLFRNNQSFGDYGLTPNQISTAGALDKINTDGALDNLVAGFSASYVANGLDLLSGEIHATLKSTLLGWSENTAQSSLSKLRSNLEQPSSSCSVGSKTSSTNSLSLPLPCGNSGWAQMLGNWNQTSSDGNAAASKSNTAGLMIGTDISLGSAGWRVGGMFGYGTSTDKSDVRHSSAKLHNYTLGMYTGKRFDLGNANHFKVMGGLSYTHHTISTDRLIPRIRQTLNAEYSGNTVQAFGEVSYALRPMGTWQLEPFFGFLAALQKIGDFTEAGGYAGVHSSAESDLYSTAIFGIHMLNNMVVSGKTIKVQGTVGMKQVLGNPEITRTMAFNQGSPDYLIWGVPRSRSTAIFNVQGQMALSPLATLEVGFNGEFGANIREQSIQARMHWAF